MKRERKKNRKKRAKEVRLVGEIGGRDTVGGKMEKREGVAFIERKRGDRKTQYLCSSGLHPLQPNMLVKITGQCARRAEEGL